ncbi:MAG: hypothetical protein JXB07_20645, partial [Anaerolineae bacterium]|nr:hypothetical protein [Anaerolineae bacterium]
MIDQDGVTTVMARSTDRVGNREEPPVSLVVRIDKTAPILTLSIEPTILWLANHKLVVVHPIVQVYDVIDPVPIVQLVSINSNEP